VKVELLYFEGCPNWRTTEDRLMALQPEFGFSLTRRLVETPEEAGRLGFRGSPAILVAGTQTDKGGSSKVFAALGLGLGIAGFASSLIRYRHP
jgi:hypothetical protein